MSNSKKNLPASVTARLLNRSRQTGDDFQTLLTSFFLERFLYRLGVSEARDNFVLKGAMLFRLWSDQPYRATRDLDLLRRGDGSTKAIQTDIERICTTPVPADSVTFDWEKTRIEQIRPTDEYAGIRTILPAHCGSARINLQIDIGTGDSVWPPPQPCTYPSILGFPTPSVLAYPRSAVIAEKLEAVVVLGDRNSRIKDFFDLYHLAKQHHFDRVTLAEAVRRTFDRRKTPIPSGVPIGFSPSYWENPVRSAQVQAFARRAGLGHDEYPNPEFIALIENFLLPILDDLRNSSRLKGDWPPGGPWQPEVDGRD